MLFSSGMLMLMSGIVAEATPTVQYPTGAAVSPGPTQSPVGDNNTGGQTLSTVRVGRKNDGDPGYGCLWAKQHLSQAEIDFLPRYNLSVDVPYIPIDGKPFDFVFLDFNGATADIGGRYNISGTSGDGNPCGIPIEGAVNPYPGCYDGGTDNVVPLTCVWHSTPVIGDGAETNEDLWHANGKYNPR